MARYTYIEKPEELKDSIQEIVRQIHEDMDPQEMNEYKRFLKENVSIFSRAYFTAYLMKHFLNDSGKRPRGKSRSPRIEPDQENREDRTNGDHQTLFVSVGKNRRVFPKDFIALLTELDGVTGESIGQIKILDSYSFVEVDSTIADRVIEAYNGFEFRGRKLTVNYARNKRN